MSVVSRLKDPASCVRSLLLSRGKFARTELVSIYLFLIIYSRRCSAQSWLQQASLEGYDTMSPPRELGGNTNPVFVDVGINIFKIVDIDIKNAIMELSVWLRMSWTDTRLVWDPDVVGVSQLAYYASNDREQTTIWVPDLELYNQYESLYDFADKPAQVFPNGFVFWSRPGPLKVLCAFRDLTQLPFDKPSCAFELGGWAKSGYDVNYEFMSPPVSFSTEESAATTYQQYKIIGDDTRTNRREYFYPCCPNEPWPVLQYEVTLDRAASYYVLKVIVPNILFAFLSFLVFWFDVRTGERLSFGVTILLAMVAVDIISSELLPICPEYLFIEVLVAVSLLFAFLALCETCLVVYWYYKR
ncbi:hypothetical protein TL16_g00440 [Triparma laevis f. inornata]|uniref:Uncharacterized protein n=1 Tax=Triparma laevis f. inornata TaxID=1714386 RepID=A0A9W7DN29_9STRA|nr:hypothetical protein TL16_g00440 [Triparma laevis f. inornata]